MTEDFEGVEKFGGQKSLSFELKLLRGLLSRYPLNFTQKVLYSQLRRKLAPVRENACSILVPRANWEPQYAQLDPD